MPRSFFLGTLLVIAAAAGTVSSVIFVPVKPCHAQTLRIEAGGHTAAVRRVLWSGDGRYLISAGLDKAVRVWDVARGKQVRVVHGEAGDKYQGAIFAAALSSGREPLLACGGYDVRLWEKYQGDAPAVKLQENRLRLISLRNGAVVSTLPGHKDAVTSLDFSPDGSLLASCCAGQNDATAEAAVWDVATHARRFRLTGHTGPVSAVAFSPDGSVLLSVGLDGTARLWQASDGKSIATLKTGAGLLCAAWINAERFAVGGMDGVVRIFNRRGDATGQIATGAQIITALAVTKTHLLVAQSSAQGKNSVQGRVAAYALSASAKKSAPVPDYTTEASPGAQCLSLSVSPDGSLAASGDDAGAVFVWNASSGANLHCFAGSGRPVRSVGWVGGDTTFAWGNGAVPTAAFDTVHLALRPLTPAAPSVTGALLHTGNTDVSFENPRSGTTGRATLLVNRAGKAIRFTDDAVRGWEAGEQITSVTLFPNGLYAAVGTDYGLGLYAIENSRIRRITRLVGHTGAVRALAPSADGRFLVSGSADQTVRIWNIETAAASKNAETPALLALFAASENRHEESTQAASNETPTPPTTPTEWIAWNPSGVYAASPSGDDMVGWQVNRGPERAAVFYSAFAFRSRYYRPDLMRLLFSAGSLQNAVKSSSLRAATLAPETIDQSLKVTPPPEIVSVRVNGTLAAGTLPVYAPDVTLAVQLADAGADATVSVRMDGRQPKRVRLTDGQTGTNRSLSVTLFHEGINLLTLVALNKQGMETRTSIAVDYRPNVAQNEPRNAEAADILGNMTKDTSPVARAAQVAASHSATQHVLVVGASRFPNSPENNLRYTATDARTFAGLFPATGKLFKTTRTTLLTDEEATSERIQRELRAIGERCAPNDEVIVYLSSHGLRGKNGAAFYFVPSDFRPDAVEETCLSWQNLLEIVNALPCRRVVLVVDTCHSGGALQEIERGINPVNELLRGAREGGTFALVSCLPSQVSWEHEAWGMSAFTYALTEAVRAQTGTGKLFTLGSVEAYARRRVESIVREKFNTAQTPTLYAPADMDPDLVLLGGTP